MADSVGGPITPVEVVTGDEIISLGLKIRGNVAIPVYGAELLADRKYVGGSARRVYIVQDSEIGGRFKLGGGAPVPMADIAELVMDRQIAGGSVIPVYLVSGQLGGSGETPIVWLLKDEFITDRAAGSVNGTAPEPGPGSNRIVTDTANQLSISGSEVAFASGAAQCKLEYSGFTRKAGQMLFVDLEITTGSPFWITQGWGQYQNVMMLRTSANALYVFQDLSLWPIGTNSPDVRYNTLVITGLEGAFYFMKGGAQYLNWTMLGRFGADSSDRQPVIAPYVNADIGFADNAGVPETLWQPIPLISDGFGGANVDADGLGHPEGGVGGAGDGGSGSNVWTGTTWSNSGGDAINTPSVGSELLTNGNMESGDPPTDWDAVASTISSAADERTGGSGAASINVARNGNDYPGARQDVTVAIGDWLMLTGWIRNVDANTVYLRITNSGDGALTQSAGVAGTTWTYEEITGLATSTLTHAKIFGYATGADGTSVRADDITLKKLTLSELMKTADLGASDVFIGVEMGVNNLGVQQGVILNLDDKDNPANFVIGIQTGLNQASLIKCVGGVYTTVLNVASTFTVGARLDVRKFGTNYHVFYNKTSIGSATISDAGIISNTIHGVFSTYNGNQLDNFYVYEVGSGGEYDSILDPYIS